LIGGEADPDRPENASEWNGGRVINLAKAAGCSGFFPGLSGTEATDRTSAARFRDAGFGRESTGDSGSIRPISEISVDPNYHVTLQRSVIGIKPQKLRDPRDASSSLTSRVPCRGVPQLLREDLLNFKAR